MSRRAQRQDSIGLLASSGVRATRARVAVLDQLAGEEGDVTAQQLWRRLQDGGSSIGLATVYRTLAILRERGIADALPYHGDEVCYRLCNAGHHHHLVCSDCHRVVEIEGCEIDEWLAEVSAEHGFVPTDHLLELTGVCSECQPKG